MSKQEGAIKMAVRQRNYRRARDRALTRLANKYPDDYKKLYNEEKRKDEAMGTKHTTSSWLNGGSGRTRSRSSQRRTISKRRKY